MKAEPGYDLDKGEDAKQRRRFFSPYIEPPILPLSPHVRRALSRYHGFRSQYRININIVEVRRLHPS